MIRVYLVSPTGERELVGETNHRSGRSLGMAFVWPGRVTDAVVELIRERIPGWDGTTRQRRWHLEIADGWYLIHEGSEQLAAGSLSHTVGVQ